MASLQDKAQKIASAPKRTSVTVDGRDCAYIVAMYDNFRDQSFDLSRIYSERLPRKAKSRFDGFQTDPYDDEQVLRDRLSFAGLLNISQDGMTLQLTERGATLARILEQENSGAEAL